MANTRGRQDTDSWTHAMRGRLFRRICTILAWICCRHALQRKIYSQAALDIEGRQIISLVGTREYRYTDFAHFSIFLDVIYKSFSLGAKNALKYCFRDSCVIYVSNIKTFRWRIIVLTLVITQIKYIYNYSNNIWLYIIQIIYNYKNT